MELPECPVCLQPFDGGATTPRVLACGHSTCETCLVDLPKPPFPGTIRCPACTQLVTYPGRPSSLPKNIDLLRFSASVIGASNPSNHEKDPQKPLKPIKELVRDFIPNLWSHEFYSNWKRWVVPENKISVDSSNGSCLYGRVVNLDSEEALLQSPFGFLMKGNQKVSLFKVGSLKFKDDSNFKYSYVAKVMWVLFEMRDKELDELGLVLRSSLREYRICTIYGLWYNEEDKGLYLVCERNDTNLLNVNVSGIKVDDDISCCALICMELCEAVSGLHRAELVTGCFAPSCFAIDTFGRVFIDLGEVLTVGGRIQKIVRKAVSLRRNSDDGKESETNLSLDIVEAHAFLSPELLLEFVHKEGIDSGFASSINAVGYFSDVWPLACLMLWLLAGKSFVEEIHNYLCRFILLVIDGKGSECERLHIAWLENISILLDTKLGLEFVVMKELLHKCLLPDPRSRPLVADLWKCMRELIVKPKFDLIGSLEQKVINETKDYCLLLGELSHLFKKIDKVDDDNDITGDCKVEELVVEGDVIKGLAEGSLKCIDLKGHLDYITGLAIGGGFLFSSSFDKTVNVWSLQDFNHVHLFKGHEHRVTAVVFVDKEQPVCISGDNGGGIFIWAVTVPFEQEPIKRLNEEKDWRYSGIHALAVSGSGYLYTGSGDKSIKAWSMHDYTLSYTMTGHKSVVSTLAVSNEVLYSGSWDGTIRLWCLSDHTPLAVLGEETFGPSTFGSVLSLAVDDHTLVAAHENGCIKIWNNDVLLKSTSAHTGAIFSVNMEGKWLFSGGWDKTVIVQELSGDESQADATQIGTIAGNAVITALLYQQGKLFVGQADKTIKVYYSGA